VLGDHALLSSRPAFLEQPAAIFERLRVQEAADRRALDQMTK